ncbi:MULTISPECIES: MFS transporter [unclassified Gordonia (in: high G+C Gram-positive bacteria)]|uniref:MFS transporter n=1 Tax=Gordonia TaxID=2053 RepID=UPI00071C40D2|nr:MULTISPECIES: MFS transporter [unclassified Gordonia (in: high G+C Gram-positive bacteria)]KSU61298.1 MFS transporter [Gordonia sp. SGD-V-85]MBN0974392.1 MFS transporter [Gordonia sp. BP-119]MBN0984082.1 MFS transporter [Gordonia sp. BP-94]MCX2753912.1 MFS transporter [Gordonia sp. 4N]MDT0220852.1 MFS transporter [Gordonia sp. AC31]
MSDTTTADSYEQLAPDPNSPEGKRLLRKAIGASAIGNATEWYDYGVYAAASVYLTQAFFPGEFGTVGTMLGFAISFVLRPLGGMVWGPIGDRIGRKSVLAMTILLISGATALIGLLPTHASIGFWAPVLLILLRVIQGFSTGGEYGGAATFMAEYAPDNKRGKYGSFLEFGTLAGFCGGTLFVLLLQLALSDSQMDQWGWRIPFLLALPMGLIGLYLRSQMEDTPVFQELEQDNEIKGSAWTRFKDLLVNYRRPIITMFGLVIALNVANYTLLAYQPTYLQNTIDLSETSASVVNLIGQLVMMLLIPFFGWWSDSTGRKPMWWGSLIGLFVLALPLYWLMGQGFAWAIVAFVILGVLYIPQLATISATFPAMFPTQVRYAGFAISYNVATAAFGGTAPLVNDAVVESTDWNLFPAVYMMGACAIGMVALCFLKETAGASLRGTEIPSLENDFTALQKQKVN